MYLPGERLIHSGVSMPKLNEADLASRDADLLEDHFFINSREARSNFSRIIDLARVENNKVIITDRGDPAAAVVPIKDVRLLDLIEKIGFTKKLEDHGYKDFSVAEWKVFLTEFKDGLEHEADN